MIYLDTSVVLAHLFAEDQDPPKNLWEEPLVSSRLLEYETWICVHRQRMNHSGIEAVRDLLRRVAMIELRPEVLSRALDPFPKSVRTLDALHLASLEFLRRHDPNIMLASYDGRMNGVAQSLGIPLYSLALQG